MIDGILSNIACSTVLKPRGLHFLYDSSGGNGKIENEYSPVMDGYYTGYAGGLTPDNLEQELIKISSINQGKTIWIDTESGVRTDNKLDMTKVESFLKIASQYVIAK